MSCRCGQGCESAELGGSLEGTPELVRRTFASGFALTLVYKLLIYVNQFNSSSRPLCHLYAGPLSRCIIVLCCTGLVLCGWQWDRLMGAPSKTFLSWSPTNLLWRCHWKKCLGVSHLYKRRHFGGQNAHVEITAKDFV